MEIIAKFLKLFNEEYEKGTCDNVTSPDMVKVLNTLYEDISSKQDKVLTTEEASIYLNVTRQTLHNYVRQGKLHPKKRLGGVKEFSYKELRALI